MLTFLLWESWTIFTKGKMYITWNVSFRLSLDYASDILLKEMIVNKTERLPSSRIPFPC